MTNRRISFLIGNYVIFSDDIISGLQTKIELLLKIFLMSERKEKARKDNAPLGKTKSELFQGIKKLAEL